MDETVAREFGKRLKKWRLACEMTQHDLSERCSISTSGIGAIENGEVLARKSTIVDIIQNGLEMSFERFFTGDIPHRRGRHRVAGMQVPNLRVWRAIAKLSTSQLAERCGVTPATINYIENGGNASTALAHRIMYIFGKTHEEMAEAPTLSVRGDAAESYLEGTTIEKIARELDEEYVKPIRQTAAEQRLDKTMADLGLSAPVKTKTKAPSLAKANEAGVVTASHEQIMSWLRADAEEARARRAEEDDEEDGE